MKKLTLLFSLLCIATAINAQNCIEDTLVQVQDSILFDKWLSQFPIFVIDGMEIPTDQLDSIAADIDTDDIEKVDIIRFSETPEVFAPRKGGVILITTKSKKRLKEYLAKCAEHEKELREKARKEGRILIRGGKLPF